MTIAEAEELLLLHSFSLANPDHPGMQVGFLGALRPYHGLKEDNFHQVMAAIIALGPHWQQEEHLSKASMVALWGICHYARAWAIQPEGMLQRNNLIATEDILTLEGWLEIISDTVSLLLEGYELDEALASYRDYQNKKSAEGV